MKTHAVLRMTKQRQIILEELCKLKNHPTADEMYQILRRKMPRISLGTVYRNLEILSDCGMIQKIDVGGTQKRFDGNADVHYHIRCISCNKVEDIDIEPDKKIENMARQMSKYTILRHHTEFIGICPACFSSASPA
ncbi:MAG: transcriptional repressor [Deltaproteobacteria bacterium]